MSESRQAISVCMIVKNEEPFIAACLSSIKDFVDEIVVVDTGSQDATVEIARSHGARIFDYPWSGDFSAARNHSIAQATGKWILILDADEKLAARDAQQLRSLVENTRSHGFKMIQRTYLWNANVVSALPNPRDYTEGQEYSNCVEVAVIRLFRNMAEIRYKGRVHELVEPAFATQRLAYETTRLVLHHFGKVGDPARVEAKKWLYLDLGRRKAEEESRDPMPRFELGVQLYELERYSECVPYFEECLKLNPAFDMALLYIAKAHHSSGRMVEAKRYYQKCLKHGPDNDKVLFDYANFVKDEGRFRAALELYQKALRINPRHSLALFNTGVVYVRLGEDQRGLSWIKRALEINPDNVSFYENLGRLGLTGDCLEEASRLIETYLKRFPESSGCHAVLGEICFTMKRFDRALECAAHALSIDPKLFSTIVLQANVLFTLGRLPEAEKSYRAALLLVSDHLDSMMNLAAIAEHGRDYASAKSWYRRILGFQPDQPQALKRYAAVQVKGGLDDDSGPILERAYSANSGDLECLLLVGELFERSGKEEMACALYSQAGARHPEWTSIIHQKVQRLKSVLSSPASAFPDSPQLERPERAGHGRG